MAKREPRKAETYRGARRNEARRRKLVWHSLPRVRMGASIRVVVPPEAV